MHMICASFRIRVPYKGSFSPILLADIEAIVVSTFVPGSRINNKLISSQVIACCLTGTKVSPKPKRNDYVVADDH